MVLTKGSKAPQVEVVCECGATFLRAIVHPYIIKCPDCRKKGTTEKKAVIKAKVELGKHLKCPDCKNMISRLAKVGMHRCPRCKDQWWSNDDGWWRRWNDDDMFYNGEYMGTLREKSYEEITGIPKMTPPPKILDRFVSPVL